MPMKQLNVTFEDDRFEELKRKKGMRSWREAIAQEFGVDSDE